MLPDPRTVAAALAFVALFAPGRARGFCRMSTSPAIVDPSECTLCDEDDPSADCHYLTWRRRCMSVAIDAGGARDFTMDELRSIVRASLDPWLAVTCGGASPGFEVRLLDEPSHCSAAEYNQDAGNVNAISFVDDWRSRDYDPSAYALTTVWHNVRTGEIYDADMEINQQTCADSRCVYTTCPAPEGCSDRTVDLRNVMTHELGHFFGMGHTDVTFASMYFISPPGEVSKRVLRTDDMEGFCAAYPPGSLPEECVFDPRGGLSLVCGGDPGGCGCHVPASPAGSGRAAWVLALALAWLVRVRRRARPSRATSRLAGSAPRSRSPVQDLTQ